MKILHIITGLNYGGAEKLLLDLCIKLNAKHEVYVIFLKTEGKMLCKYKKNGIKVFKFDIERNGVVKTFFRLYIFIKNTKIDVVHTHCAHANFIGRTVALLAGVSKVFTTIHSTDEWMVSKRIIHKILKNYDRILIMPNNSNIIAISNAVKEYIIKKEKINSKKIIVIPNAIDVESIKQNSKDVNIANNFKRFTNDNDFIICSVGRLVKQKGHIILLKSMREILENNKINNIKCIIIGDGEEKEYLSDYIKKNNLSNNVFLLGEKDNPYPFIKKANLFVMPSLYEGFGIVIIEAFALRVPVLSTNADGLKELVINNETGIAIKIDDYKMLYKEILNFYFNKYDVDKFVNNAYAFLMKNYTIEKYAEAIEELYKR